MKKEIAKDIKKILGGILIAAVTAAVGLAISFISFGAFSDLSPTEMKLLFASDIAALLAVGSAAWFIYESKSSKRKRRSEFEKRRSNRVQKEEPKPAYQNRASNNIIYGRDFAA